MAKLVLHREGGEMRDIPLDQDRITIGRRADHDVCLPYPAVSADHAEIITVIADSFLHDLGSTNGTFVNGERVTKHFLRDHDKIDIGRQQLVYLTNEAETVGALPADNLASKEIAPEPTDAAAEPEHASVASGPSEASIELRDARAANVDELMTDLMDMHGEASMAVEMAPTVSAARSHAKRAHDSYLEATVSGGARSMRNVSGEAASGSAHPIRNGHADATSAVVEILSGPNAGRVAPMHKPEFLLGKLGATVAKIRKESSGYRLVPIDPRSMPLVNGRAIGAEGAVLAFGDTIDVAGVKLRFDRSA